MRDSFTRAHQRTSSGACIPVEDRDAVYKTSVIPKRNISETMDVEFSVNLNQIIELNEREQSLLLSVVLRYS